VFSRSRWSRKSPSWCPLRSELLHGGIFAVHVRWKVTRIRKSVKDPSAFCSVLERQPLNLNAARRARQFPRTWLRYLR
jgi:hypothetical protein